MELDNIKQSWKQQSPETLKPLNNHFMELIQNKSYGPAATLKEKFKKQLVAFPIFLGVVIYDFVKRPELINDITMWLFILVAVALTGYFWFNFSIIKRMQNFDTPIKSALEKEITTLESGFRRYFIASRIVFILMVVLLELSMSVHASADFESWHSVSLLVRMLVYTAGFVFHYFMGKRVFENQYGAHIMAMKETIKKMEE